MKFTKSEFEAQLGIARTLPKDARKAMLDGLKTAKVYETDAEGNETEVKMTVVEFDDPTPVTKSETITKADIDRMVAEALKEHAKPATKAVDPVIEVKATFDIPKLSKMSGMPFQCFKGEREGMSAEKRAFAFGMWTLANIKGEGSRAAQWCKLNGFPLVKTHTEGTDTAGGHTVPEQFLGDLINLVNTFGVFRRFARVIPMTSETFRQPRVSGRLTAYFVSENSTGTTSDATFDAISLTAKKLAVNTSLSSELNEDTASSLGDWLASDIARAFAYTEDDCGFNGDGTSTYGSITGVRSKLSTLNGVDDGGGLVLGTGNAYSELTAADYSAVVGRTPTYALNGAGWFVSPTVFNHMQRVAYASGGVTANELKGGDLRPVFLGYPVNLVEVMPSTAGNSQICALFGNLSLAATFGDRRMPTIFTSEHVYATQDAIYVRGTERFDINVHDVGTSSVAGPVVGLITASS